MDDLFIVIDNQTGEEISDAEVTRIVKEGGLIEADIDCFAITQEGSLILLDDCGNVAYLDMSRFSYKLL